MLQLIMDARVKPAHDTVAPPLNALTQSSWHRLSSVLRSRQFPPLMPAQAGIQFLCAKRWIPASAGMTVKCKPQAGPTKSLACDWRAAAALQC